jgi:hypothetical protein
MGKKGKRRVHIGDLEVIEQDSEEESLGDEYDAPGFQTDDQKSESRKKSLIINIGPGIGPSIIHSSLAGYVEPDFPQIQGFDSLRSIHGDSMHHISFPPQMAALPPRSSFLGIHQPSINIGSIEPSSFKLNPEGKQPKKTVISNFLPKKTPTCDIEEVQKYLAAEKKDFRENRIRRAEKKDRIINQGVEQRLKFIKLNNCEHRREFINQYRLQLKVLDSYKTKSKKYGKKNTVNALVEEPEAILRPGSVARLNTGRSGVQSQPTVGGPRNALNKSLDILIKRTSLDQSPTKGSINSNAKVSRDATWNQIPGTVKRIPSRSKASDSYYKSLYAKGSQDMDYVQSNSDSNGNIPGSSQRLDGFSSSGIYPRRDGANDDMVSKRSIIKLVRK